MKDGFKEYLGDKILFNEELDNIIKKVDFNGNGTIEFSEFITACSNVNKMLTEKNLFEAFNLFDLD